MGPVQVTSRVLLLAAALAGGSVAWWWTHPEDPSAELRAHAPRVARVLREPFGVRGLERWRLVMESGDTLTGLWRPDPRGRPSGDSARGSEGAAPIGGAAAGGDSSRASVNAAPTGWAAVMMGGLVTGRHTALLLPDDLPVAVLALEWPWHGPRRMSPLKLLAAAPDIRRAVLAAPGVFAAGIDALEWTGCGSRARIVSVGVSLGVPVAVAALRVGPRPAALVLVDGAADLAAMIARGLEREGTPAWLAAPLARLGARLIRPLEPSLHGDAGRGLRVLMINSRDDERLPRRAIERLHTAFPGAEVRWREGGHVRPSRRETLKAVAYEICAWL